MLKWLKRLARCQDGATAVEYGLIAALIVVTMMGALSAMSDTTIGIWNSVSTNVVNAGQQ